MPTKVAPKPLKVCYVVCNKYPDYVRTEVLSEALSRLEGVELLVVKNQRKGWRRYPEVIAKMPKARLGFRPDVFIVGFRGYEIFWLLYPFMAGKPKIFDEFVNLYDWMVHEHRKFGPHSLPAKMLVYYMRRLAGRCRLLLMDTPQHAELAAKVYRLPPTKVKALPVGADEAIFYPRPVKTNKKRFEVFFFGNMLPLHGIEVMLDAINKVLASSSVDDYHFTLAGGQGSPEMLALIDRYIKASPKPSAISHHPWIEYAKLADYIAKADLCLGGPFGNTGQAQRVISGKTYQFMAMAKATVVGASPAHQLFKDRQNSLVVPQGDAEALAEAITWAHDRRAELPQIGKSARRLYQANYSTDKIASQLKSILDDL